MPISKKLPSLILKAIRALGDETTIGEIRELQSELNDWVERQNDARGEKSDNWQESDEAGSHEAFVSTVETLASELELVFDAFDNMDTSEPEYEG